MLGPAEDGGYYLLGMQQPHAHLFADIAWSTSSVATATVERALSLGLNVVTLPTWYDVDDAAWLAGLLAEQASGSAAERPYATPATMGWLAHNGFIRHMGIAAQ